ncbi:MAG: META domain-containing protein [Treponema sp.]|jgi:heat shock protein HslJ|nr:META domain-containing protein [Treponema sp.]
MGNYYKTARLVLILTGVLTLAACGSTPKFSDVRDKEWKLIAVRTAPEDINFDRTRLIDEGFGDIFTIQFSADQVSGKGAPNRYFGPFEVGSEQAISIKNVAATLMAPIREPEKLKERDFFVYLQNTYRWTINKRNLEISTRGESGADAVMVFVFE